MKQYAGVDAYLEESNQWPDAIRALRPVLLDCGLTEAIKWGKPCYTHGGKNIVILQEMKGFLALMFFKGALLSDPEKVLVDQGPNSRSARRIEVTSVEDVSRLEAVVKAYVAEAIAIEDAGLEVGPAPPPKLVEELEQRLGDDPALQAAFESLTPGRQREYNLYFSGAKRAETRATRVDKYISKILAGKGLRDR